MSERENVRIDWSRGPVRCRGCKRMLRPRGRKPVGVWEGTIRAEARGRCPSCYRDEQTKKKIPAVVETLTAWSEFLWRWPIVAWGVPRAHMEVEAMADLMDHLEAMGWVLIRRPERLECIPGSEVLEWRVEVMEATSALRQALEARPATSVFSGRGQSWAFSRALLPEGVSLVHQELDIVADVAGVLRERGMVAVGAPERRPVAHGLSPVMRVRVPVRPATAAEALALGCVHVDVDAAMPADAGAEAAA